jgi:4'-phosphopantetheinyl transferase
MNGNNRAALGVNEVHVCIAYLDRPESEVRFFESLLAADETQRAKRFYFQKDRERFVVGRGLLRTILSSYLQLPPDEILFAYGAHGKPTVKQKAGQSGIEFNLAHSAGWGIYAITQDRPVGVDVEFIQRDFPGENVAEHFFSPRETASLRALPKDRQTAAFFSCWSRKEAFIKALGLGLSCPLGDFDVSLAPGEPARLLYVKWDPHEVSRWFMADIDRVPGCAAAVVVAGTTCRLVVSEWSGTTAPP